GLVRRDRGQPFVDEPDLEVRSLVGQCGGELRGEVPRLPGRGALGAVQGSREPHHDDTGLRLERLEHDTPHGRAALERLDGGRDHPVQIAAGEADADIAHVDPQPDAAGQARGVLRRSVAGAGHAVRAASIAARTAVSAAGIRAGSPPPPWAMSGLPPPRPPIASAAPRRIVPAASPRSRAAALVAITSAARPPSCPATAIITGMSSPSRLRRSRARVRRSPAPTPSPASCASRRTPSTSVAFSTSLPASAC